MSGKEFSLPKSLVPTNPDISKCGISQLVDAGRDDGFPVIVLTPKDPEYKDTLRLLLCRHQKEKDEEAFFQSEACKAWIQKVDKASPTPQISPNPNMHPAMASPRATRSSTRSKFNYF